ncbi:MFS transporter [Pantoea sp. USHLN256]|uniref:MFS transporter n=1 Tax=Pantoea sp. USHLN256 TaxID=3081293 RepID=UPI0030168263
MKNCALGLTGFALIAVTYGMARFAWGLMMPDVMRAIPFTPRISGVLAACSFAAYCVAVMLAPMMTARAGARMPASVAALCAAAGMLILALASSAWMLGAGLFIAGLSAGLASPALAAAVSQRVDVEQQPQMNTLINAGTSMGIMLSVPILFWLPGGWRAACALFALLALCCMVPLWRQLPAEKETVRHPSWYHSLRQRSLQWLIVIALVSGIASAAWWSFGPELLQRIAVKDNIVSLLWLIAGAAGIVGALTGPMAKWLGMSQVYRLSQCCLAIPLLVLAASHHASGWLFPAVALGGAAYVTLSGVLLVWGAAATEQAPATGVGMLFFMLAAGQVIGSLMFGQLYSVAGAPAALLLFAALPLLMLFLIPRNA